MSDLLFITNAVSETLQKWNLEGSASTDKIAPLIIDGTAYWELTLPDGSHLALVRLFSPAVRRVEIFLGNVLLNDFLSKSLIRAVEQGNKGQMALLTNDLESYYYLYHGKSSLESISDLFRQEVSSSLPDLYFGCEVPGRGIYGDHARMLTFYKSNIEPYPAFSVPSVLLPQLLRKANEALGRLASDKETNINVIFAVLNFFYAMNGAEMQSFHAFLKRAMDEGLLPAEKIWAVFALGQGEDFEKETFMERKKGEVIDRPKLQEVLEEFLAKAEAEIALGQAEALASYLAEKMPALSLDQTAELLLNGVQLGFLIPSTAKNVESTLSCRFCGADSAIIVEKNIICGFGAGRFCNESPKSFEESLCGRCGISSYLVTKLLGMHNARPQPKSKDYPVPKQYNIVFHYGQHDHAEVQRLRDTIDDIFDLLGEFRKKATEEKRAFSLEYMKDEISKRAKERRASSEAEEKSSSPEDYLAALIEEDDAVPGLDILAQTPQEERAQVLPLGSGEYRLIVFIMPRLHPGREEAMDFLNSRLSRSRLAAFTLLALLRKLCGCDGPFYFQSAPTLRPNGFDPDTFYVRGKAENAKVVIKRYSAIINFARKVCKYRDGHSRVADWILLAEKLEDDPMGVISEILRNSPLRGGDDLRDSKYKRLSNEFIKGTSMIDGTDYLRMIEQLKQFYYGWEIMPKKVDTEKLNEFCEILFRVLDRLGGGREDLLPLFLSEKPTSYEKYPRLLLSHIRYYNDVEAGFEEWKSKVLRDSNDYRKDEEYPEVLVLKKWLMENRSLFENHKDNLNHLKRSLYARVYEYLYPRRLLTGAYAEANRGNSEALEEDAIRSKFRQEVKSHIDKLSVVYGNDEKLQKIIDEAEEYLIANRKRYIWKLKEMAVIAPSA